MTIASFKIENEDGQRRLALQNQIREAMGVKRSRRTLCLVYNLTEANIKAKEILAEILSFFPDKAEEFLKLRKTLPANPRIP